MHETRLARDAPTTSSSAVLAEHLRDGPLLELIELQRQASVIASRPPGGLADQDLHDLEHLVRLSLAAMERFHAFTRELEGELRAATDARH